MQSLIYFYPPMYLSFFVNDPCAISDILLSIFVFKYSSVSISLQLISFERSAIYFYRPSFFVLLQWSLMYTIVSVFVFSINFLAIDTGWTVRDILLSAFVQSSSSLLNCTAWVAILGFERSAIYFYRPSFFGCSLIAQCGVAIAENAMLDLC